MKKLILLLLLVSPFLLAFDTRSHVWIAQEVINDLEDGSVTIEPYGDFAIDPAIVSAILDNKRIYRMGNIGPDGFPDVIGGQVTVHPGLEDGATDDAPETVINGWKSDTWFKWVLSQAQTPQEKAFAYGFLGHGASDTFAHTYVNMYAGDIFDMNDGETDVEKRHIFLEKFISDRLPAYKDAQGNAIGEAFELVAVDDELPVAYIKNALLMNDDVAAQYALSGTAGYLAKLYEFRQKIAALDDNDTQNTVNEDLVVAEEECSSAWYPGKYLFSIFTSQDEACDEKNFLADKLAEINLFKSNYDLSNYSFKKAWLAQIDHAIDEYIKVSSRMSQAFMRVDGDSYSELTNWIQCYGTSFSDPTTLASQVIEESCNISNQVKSELSFLNDVQDKIDFTLLSELKSEVKGLSDGLGVEIIDLIGVAALEIVTVKELDVSEASLDDQFGMDQSDKHLLLINNIAERVKLEMGLNMYNELNPQMYHVLYNAIVLSKLSLLSAEQLNELITRAGTALSYQYIGMQGEPFNILFDSIKTIDGNHQWLFQAPPYPRALDFDDTTDHFYGYLSDATHGFKLFESDEMRFNLFNKIFKGPLSLGLETPAVIQQSALLSSNYPYVSCAENPFPNGIDDRRCDIVTLPDDENTSLSTAEDESWWNTFIRYLKETILAYFYDIVGQENILSTTETEESIEIITTVPNDGIEF